MRLSDSCPFSASPLDTRALRGYNEKVEIRIDYTVEYRDRRSACVTVRPDGSVRVLAGRMFSLASLDEFVAKRAVWIIERQTFYARMSDFAPEVYLLGRRYEVVCVHGEGRRGVERDDAGGRLVVRAPEGAEERTLRRWFAAEAERELPRIFREEEERVLPLVRAKASSVGVVGVRSFYGRCHTATGRIDLARMLIHAPEECVRAICCHELAHLVYKSHGTRFKALVRRICPQADEATALLECRGCASWEGR